MFIRPALETDAVFDPIRTTNYLGIWYLSSLLKEKGYNVRCLDEVVRNGGFEKRVLFERTIRNGEISETQIDMTFEEFRERKMADFKLSEEDFLAKYSAFRKNGEVNRTMVRTGNPIQETLKEIWKWKPDVVGIPLVATANYVQSVKLGKAIKDTFPAVKVVYGGQHFLAGAEDFLREYPWVDHIVINDAITVIEGIVEGRRSEKIIDGGFQEMSAYPLLDPALIEENGYPSEPTYTFTSSGRKTVDFMFSRGCFRHCDFCVAGCQKGNHLTRAYDRLDAQLQLFKEHGYEEIVIQDDAFIPADERDAKKHLERILGLMKKYGFFWQNNGGIDFELLSDEVMDQFIRYNQSGEGRLTSLYVPFNPRGAVEQKKQSAAGVMIEKHNAHLENLKRLRNAGVYVFSSEIIGTPEHTVEVLEEDIRLHEQLVRDGYLDAALTLVATLLPATKWYREHANGIVDVRDYAGYSLFTVHARTRNISDPRIIERFLIRRAKSLNSVQQTYPWGSAFPNTK
ncbi:MAG TPA: cobalamin-dependent protein [Candidatus Fimivivens sp.]|nr:cobalamin-dependent protein [Candidatus Fimivivens sp.]